MVYREGQSGKKRPTYAKSEFSAYAGENATDEQIGELIKKIEVVEGVKKVTQVDKEMPRFRIWLIVALSKGASLTKTMNKVKVVEGVASVAKINKYYPAGKSGKSRFDAGN